MCIMCYHCFVLKKWKSRISSQVSRALRTKISNNLSLFFVYYNDCFACSDRQLEESPVSSIQTWKPRDFETDKPAEAKLLSGESLL